ncbi:hypothetical protein Aab01nite_62800 [Paractinoplanes abujensis]|uniref:Putative membrane protein YeiH n=1 Tax=Paractinoplanes abujensis TaxID=882441 RepID=A0A7W7CTQ5_9ACTN|nr:putative membrane protein YeiH [Actinoplanes abujensis]GID22690.1 hypothetical protein Aab01nite_62800 [Actinoplanes abujensis]
MVGTRKAIGCGMGPLPAAALGVLTGVGGGVPRDVLAREVPARVSPEAELYAGPAAAGADRGGLLVARLPGAGGHRHDRRPHLRVPPGRDGP